MKVDCHLMPVYNLASYRDNMSPPKHWSSSGNTKTQIVDIFILVVKISPRARKDGISMKSAK